MSGSPWNPGRWKIGRLQSYFGGSGIAFRRVYFLDDTSDDSYVTVQGPLCDHNAHLISAAPDLYEALSNALAAGLPDVVADAAREALAKARGEA